MTPQDDLGRIFEADRQAREAERAILSRPRAEVISLLRAAVQDAFDEPDPEDASSKLRRLADLCAQLPGPEMVDALVAILDHADPQVRREAGEALLDVDYERFKEVARAVERALERGHAGIAMQELPFVLTEIRDPDPVPLLARFLAHPEAEIVACAIEALAAYGDPAAAPHIEALVDDERIATLEDVDDGPTEIGELALAALEELGADEP